MPEHTTTPPSPPPSAGPQKLDRSVRSYAANAGFWTALAMGIGTICQLGGLAILGRLLPPSDFGLMGMAMVVIGFSGGMSNLGLGNAIIQRKEISDDQLSTLYWTNLLASFATALFIWLLIPAAVWFYKEPRVSSILMAMSAFFVLQGFGQQFSALLRKNFYFKHLAAVDIVGAVAGLIVEVVMALAGFGVFALVGLQLTMASTKSIMLLVFGLKRWRPRFHFSKADLKGFISFGLFQMGERNINLLASNLDYLIIGRFLGSTALGYYTLAYQLVTIPLNKLNPILTQFSLPVMSVLQDANQRISEVYQKILQALALVTLPLLVGLALTARPAVLTLFGPQWENTVPLVHALVLLGIFRSLINPCGSVFLSKGRADIGFYRNLIVTVVYSAVFYVAVQYGTQAVAWSYSALLIIDFFIILIVIRWLVGFDFGNFAKLLRLPLASVGLMAIAVLGVKYGLVAAGLFAAMPLYGQLVALAITGGIVYVGSLLILDRELVVSTVQSFISRGKKA